VSVTADDRLARVDIAQLDESVGDVGLVSFAMGAHHVI
jgi:hypothetical protein